MALIIFRGLKTEKSEWRHLANVDDLRNLRYDSGAITRGHHARRLSYKIMSTNAFNVVYFVTIATAMATDGFGHIIFCTITVYAKILTKPCLGPSVGF